SPSREGGPAVLRPDGPGFVGLVVALQSVAITYGGWQSALYFTEEDRDPRRNLPRSMIGGVLSVLVIYLLVNLALLSVLPVGALARSDRKSTRLNSSHVAISYAVFCLKKKNRNQESTSPSTISRC